MRARMLGFDNFPHACWFLWACLSIRPEYNKGRPRFANAHSPFAVMAEVYTVADTKPVPLPYAYSTQAIFSFS